MPTITDVARRAGVSVSTVSYALSGKRRISEQTRERVRAAIRALDYQPNAGAQALRSRRTQIIALVMPMAEYFSSTAGMGFVHAVTAAARRHGYDILLMTADEGDAGLRRVAQRAVADAVLVMEVSVSDPRVETVRKLRLPAALIGQPADPQGLAWVDFDFAAAGALCVEHLAGLGHRRIGFLGPVEEAFEREMGYALRGLSSVEVSAQRLGVDAVTRRLPVGRREVTVALSRLLRAEPELTALAVQSEEAVATVQETLRVEGVRVPDDLSLVAVTSAPNAERISPTLTYVEVPISDMASHAVALVVDVLTGTAPDHALLPAVLHERGSTGPPRGGTCDAEAFSPVAPAPSH